MNIYIIIVLEASRRFDTEYFLASDIYK